MNELGRADRCVRAHGAQADVRQAFELFVYDEEEHIGLVLIGARDVGHVGLGG